MPFCPACGVEVETPVRECPLCQTPIPDLKLPETEAAYPDTKSLPMVSSGRKRIITWSLISAALLMSFLLSMTTDLLREGEIENSRYVMASTLMAWLVVTNLIFLHGRFVVQVLLLTITVVAYLAGIDLCHKGLYWFLPLGLPIAAMTSLALFWLRFTWKGLRMRKANFWGMVLITVTNFCMGLNLLISAFDDEATLDWSLIVLAALLPLAALLFYIHYVLAKRVDFSKFFHV